MHQVRKLIILLSLLSTNVNAYVDLGLFYSFTSRRIQGAEIVGSDEDPGEAITTSTGAGSVEVLY